MLDHDQQKDGFSDDRKKEINSARMNLNNLLRTRAEFQIQRTRRNYYFYGSKPSCLLALSLQKCEKYPDITAIYHEERVLTALKEINTEFK